MGARFKFWRRSRVPKNGSRDKAVGISRGFAARDGSAVKSQLTILQRLRRQISLDYYTIPPATQATIFLAATAPFAKSRASYFRFARFNTSTLYYLRAWHRLVDCEQSLFFLFSEGSVRPRERRAATTRDA